MQSVTVTELDRDSRVSLLPSRRAVEAATETTQLAGDVSDLELVLVLSASALRGSGSVAFTVETSSDNATWSTVHSASVDSPVEDVATVDAAAYVRVSADLGSLRSAVVSALAIVRSAAGGGGSQIVTEAGYYQGNTVNIENGVTGTVGFDLFASGDDVLNVTNPLLPLARKAGLFIVSCEVECGTLTAGGSFQAQLILDVSGNGVEIDGTGVAASNFVRNLASVSGQYVLAAGGSLRMDVLSGDGAATRGFSITNALVARIGPA